MSLSEWAWQGCNCCPTVAWWVQYPNLFAPPSGPCDSFMVPMLLFPSDSVFLPLCPLSLLAKDYAPPTAVVVAGFDRVQWHHALLVKIKCISKLPKKETQTVVAQSVALLCVNPWQGRREEGDSFLCERHVLAIVFHAVTAYLNNIHSGSVFKIASKKGKFTEMDFEYNPLLLAVKLLAYQSFPAIVLPVYLP